jgi:V/A-type H+-transporting ATPase subunit C
MEMVSEFDEVASFVPDKEMLEIIRMPYDFNNVKVALKSVFRAREGGERRHDLLTKLGAVDPERVILAVEGEEYDLLPYGLWHVLPQCRSLWEQTRSPRDAELLLDDCMFKAMLQHARKLGMPGLTSWVRLRIDAENITTAMRLARMKFDQSASLKFFHDGGTISPQNACRLLAEPVESWSKVLSYTPFGALLEADPKSPPSAPTSALRGPGYTAEGVVLHLLMKEAEARSLRLALVCVANGLNRDAVRRLMSHGR